MIEEAARLLGVSRRTVYYRIRAGLLQTMRTRCGSQRVLWSSIEMLLEVDRGEPSRADDETDPQVLDTTDNGPGDSDAGG